ncbi:SipW-dependent-type signal peptide-containing protein [Dietzia sp. SLG310A2-38A2]|uniref:SipW-dependent-type signal peptide-containing protein n=1 Tax=Dietzia sp. SLG310A2-38A2 TaxID=1630643 RepID=UPI001F50ECB2|nr:SipW-dependent-type signal peptide-containing protein [Dietzia sp. SLG310A2-38A2]
MNANEPLTPDAQLKQQERSRKRKAILAGGVVLGLGAAVTLAAWSDDVFAGGTFNTGSFELQGSTNGTAFADYDGPDGPPPAETATLAFQLDALQMAPSQTVYAPLTIATSVPTSLDGTFTLDSVSAAGSYDEVLTYHIYSGGETHGESCNPTEAAVGLTPWTGGDTAEVNAVVGLNTPLEVEAGQIPAGRQHLCIAVTMGNVPAEGPAGDATRAANQTAVEAATVGPDDATTVTWVFNGLSTDA